MTLRDRLRTETSTYHERLTTKLDLMRPAMTISDYRTVLQKLYGLLNPLEHRIRKVSDWDIPELALRQRFKTNFIAKDLLVLGVDSQHLQLLPTCPRLPAISNFAEMLGCMYVLEGSTLGGQFLSQHFQDRFRINSDTGCSYFSSYGADIFEMWSRFVIYLNNYGIRYASDTAKVTAGAIETFQSFETWLAPTSKIAETSNYKKNLVIPE